MADMIFRGTPYGDPFIIRDSWPQWQKDMWLEALGAAIPEPPVLVPTFEEQHFSQGGSEAPTPLNPDYFATQETAIALMRRFNATQVSSVPKQYTTPPAAERYLVWPDGIAVNAGLLAKQFVLNAANQRVAAANCESLIANQRRAGTKLPTVT